MRSMRNMFFGAAGALVTASRVLGPVVAAEAAVVSYKVVRVEKYANQIGAQVIGSYLIRTDNGTCTITSGKSASREIGLTLGATRDQVAAGLSISAGKTVTTTVSCASPPLKSGSYWKARPMGTKYFYYIEERYSANGMISTKTSSRLTAFNPSSTSIACGTS